MPKALLFSTRKALICRDAVVGDSAEDVDRVLALCARTSCLSVLLEGATTSFSRLIGGKFGTKILCVFQEPWWCDAKTSLLESAVWLYTSG